MILTNLETLKLPSADFKGTEEELNSLIECLEFDLKNSPRPGFGLSAIQIGVPVKVAIIRLKEKTEFKGIKKENVTTYNLYNTEIIKSTNSFIFKGEGCLSIPNKFCDTKRFNEITVKNGDGKEYKFSGLLAVIVQHELSHFNGETIFDYEVKKEVL